MKKHYKKIYTGIVGTLLLGAIIVVPIIPENINCFTAGDETEFSTNDGYLHKNQYAITDNGEYFWADRNGVFKKEPIENNRVGLTEVNVVGMRYWGICDVDGKKIKTRMTEERYKSLPTAQGIKNEIKKPVISFLDTDTAYAAIAFGSVASGRNSSGSSLTVAFTCNAGDYIITGFNVQDSNPNNHRVTKSTYGGVSLNKIIATKASSGVNITTELWDLTSSVNLCNGTSKNLVGATFGSVGEFAEGIMSFTGVNACPRDVAQGKTGNSSGPNVAISPTATGSWSVTVAGAEAAFTAFGTQTDTWGNQNQSFENSRGARAGPLTPKTPKTLGYSISSGQPWNVSAANFLPSEYNRGLVSICGGQVKIQGGEVKIQ